MSGIRLDLLPQAIDVRFRGVGLDTPAIAPDVPHDGREIDRSVAVQVQVPEQCRLLCGQENPAPGRLFDQRPVTAIKEVTPDLQNRGIRLFELPQMSPKASEQQAEVIRFGDEVVGSGIERKNRFGLGPAFAQDDDRRRKAAVAQHAAKLAAVDIGQDDVHQQHVEAPGFDESKRLLAGRRGIDPGFDVRHQLRGECIATRRITVNHQNPSARRPLLREICFAVLPHHSAPSGPA